MKTKYPETVWVGFRAFSSSPTCLEATRKDAQYRGQIVKRYRLDRGNEVARALNILRKINQGYLDGYDAGWVTHLRRAGFRVRWDSKRGCFV